MKSDDVKDLKKAQRLYRQVLFLGFVVLAGSGYFLAENVFIVFRYNPVQAEVIEVKETFRRTGDKTRTYIPTVRYRTGDGRTIVSMTTYASSMFDFRKGERVRVYYDPKDPYMFKIGTFMAMWPAPLTGFCIGLLILWSSRGLKPDETGGHLKRRLE